MIQTLWLLLVLLLAYANGANDQFKPVATLWGSRTLNFRCAVRLSTLATILGGITALFLAKDLLRRFTGVGLVPDDIVAQPRFIVAVTAGAAVTVISATKMGVPVSTTHAIVGALFGAGISAIGTRINWTVLGKVFFLPLAASPLMAAVLCGLFYHLMHRIRYRLGWEARDCLCMGAQATAFLYPKNTNGFMVRLRSYFQPMVVASSSLCRRMYNGSFLGLPLQQILDLTHIGSAFAVAFARGLNDTPKIVALLLAYQIFDINTNYGLVIAAMIAGGLLHSHPIAVTMSRRITPLNSGQGVCANLITALLVILASRFGIPVSTTHTSCGTLFGIGVVSQGGRWRTILFILSAWLITLPLSAAIAFFNYRWLDFLH